MPESRPSIPPHQFSTTAGPSRDIAIYLHFPFCSKLCSYCDFHKDIFDRRREKLFFEALHIDTALAAAEWRSQIGHSGAETVAALPPVVSVYVGGGTPSLANTQLFAEWVTQVRKLFRFANDVEFTMEVNPESANKDNLAEFKALGVNRLSVGVQSFDCASLEILNRRHKIEDTHRVFYVARALGFENYSADLIFGLPGQSLLKLQNDLVQLVELEATHVSYYQLTVKENTELFNLVADGRINMADDDTMAIFYDAGRNYLIDQGFERYEVSSFAKDGKKSRHNQRYWTGEPYIALGPSAHGFDGLCRYNVIADTNVYIDSLLKDGRRPLVWDDNTRENRMVEELIVGLRATAGVSVSRFESRWGAKLGEIVNAAEYGRFVECGYLIPEGGVWRLSEEALALADEITLRLLA